MTTLTDYAHTHFPNHATEVSANDLSLTAHSAVAHVVGSANSSELIARVRTAFPDVELGSVLVRPTTPTVTPEGGEDPEGVVDLPNRRLATAAVVGALAVGGAVGLIVGFVTDSLGIGLISGFFAAILGGTVAAIAGGGARYGGGRAWEQPHAPDRTIGLIAAFTTSEEQAAAVARVMEELDPYEVRIVSEDGSWHSPNT